MCGIWHVCLWYTYAVCEVVRDECVACGMYLIIEIHKVSGGLWCVVCDMVTW